MDRVLEYLLGAASFVPHGYCLLWRPDLVAMHVVSDAAIALAYFLIPGAILAFALRRDDITGEARQIAVLFSAFIVLCGITHLGGAVTLWYPAYGLEGMLKAVTAVVSLGTAVVTWRLMPRLVAWPSPRQMAEANRLLVAEIEARDAARRQLEEIRARLETEVAERTAELAQVKQLFEIATEGARMTVYAQDADLRYTWIHNPASGLVEAEVVGKRDEDLLPPEAAATSIRMKRRVLATGAPARFDLEVAEGGSSTWLQISVSPRLDDGRIVGIVCTATNITRPKRLEAMRSDLSTRLAQTVQRLDLALKSSGMLVFVQDTELRYAWANTADTPYGPLVGRSDFELLNEPERATLIAYKRRALASGEPQYCEAEVGPEGNRRWWDLHIEPTFTETGEVAGITCAAVDITERKHGERQMRLVMRELTHRSKNLLAVVQAIARQTAQQASTVAEFVTGFGQRLRSLAGAQDLLVAEDWGGVQLSDLIRNQVGHYMPEDEARVVIQGPVLRLPPEATQTIGLAMHELATNAAKYGALSNDDGKVEVTWRLDGEGEEESVVLEWRESGGPTVQQPTRRGFGRIVVERNVAVSLEADVKLDFDPAGVTVRFRIPRRNLID